MVNHIVLVDNGVLTLSVSDKDGYKDGYWLYDKQRRMNLSMRAKSERDAFIEALTYYQQRLSSVETSYNAMRSRLHGFMEGEGWKERDEDEDSFLSSYR